MLKQKKYHKIYLYTPKKRIQTNKKLVTYTI